MASEACLLNTPANFIASFIAPPVILDVSVYLKSARTGTLNGVSSRMDTTIRMAFTAFPPCVDALWNSWGVALQKTCPRGLGSQDRARSGRRYLSDRRGNHTPWAHQSA